MRNALLSLPFAVLLTLAAGCSHQTARDLPLDKALAKQSLQTALDAWKAGKTPADMKAQTPSIIIGDDSWTAGKKLTSYEFVGTDTDDGTNMHITVKLTIDGRAREVVYIVGTSPYITIFPEI